MAEQKLKATLGLDTKEFDRNLQGANKGVEKFALSLKGLGSVAGIGTLASVFAIAKKGIESTGDASNKLHFQIAGINGALVAMGQNLVTLDFSRSFVDAYNAAKQLSETMDGINDQMLSITILDSQNAVTIAKLRNDLKDTSLTNEERLGKEKEIQTLIEEELRAHKAIVEQQLAAVNASNAMKYGITTEQANLYLDYLTNYSKLTETQRKQLALALQLQRAEKEQINNSGRLGQLDLNRLGTLKEMRAAAASLPAELQKYIPISNIILDYTDEEKQKIAQIIIGYNRANVQLIKQAGFADRIGDKLQDQEDNQIDSLGIMKRETAEAKRLHQTMLDIAEAAKLPPTFIDVTVRNKKLPFETGDYTDVIPQGMSESALEYLKTAPQVKKLTDEETAAFRQLGAAISSLGGATDNAAAAWLNYIGNLLSTIPSAIAAMQALTAAEQTKATASGTAAAAGAASSVSAIPIVGPILAVAAIASVMAALLSMPKLADGGMAFGPTSALIGEYPGAASNPEVVAPLSKLKDVIGGGEGGNYKLVGKLKGRDIYLSAQRYSNGLNSNS